MQQQTLERPVSQIVEVSPNGRLADVLVRLWDEAEQAVVAQRRPDPAPRQVVQAKPARVRYAYD